MNKNIRNIIIATALCSSPLYAQNISDIKPNADALGQHMTDERYVDYTDAWNIPPPSGIEWILRGHKAFPNKYTPINELEKSYLSYKFIDNDRLTGKIFFNRIPLWYSPDSYQISIRFNVRIE